MQLHTTKKGIPLCDDLIQRIHDRLGLLSREPFPLQLLHKPVCIKVVSTIVLDRSRG